MKIALYLLVFDGVAEIFVLCCTHTDDECVVWHAHVRYTPCVRRGIAVLLFSTSTETGNTTDAVMADLNTRLRREVWPFGFSLGHSIINCEPF